MEKNLNFESSLKEEIRMRVEFYEQNPEYLKSNFAKVHYVFAGVLTVIGLIMSIAGVYS